MSIVSSIEIRGQITGLALGTRNISVSLSQNQNAPSQVTQVYLASGNNVIAVPANALGCIIQFHPTATAAKILKGVSGDTGITVAFNGTILLTFTSTPPANFSINSAAAEASIPTEVTFF